MQEYITSGLNKIIEIICKETNNDKYIGSCTVSLIPPVSLMLQLIEMTLSSVGNIVSTFTNLGLKIDPYYILKQYVPHIDWDEFQTAALKYQENQNTRANLGGNGGGNPGGGMY